MEEYEKSIIGGLKSVDENSVNMSRNEINAVIEKLMEKARENHSEKWQQFLLSEQAYYNNCQEEAFQYNLRAYELDSQEADREKKPLNYYIVSSLAVSYYVRRDFQNAEVYFTQAISLEPHYYQAYIDRATVYRADQKYENALKDISYVLKHVETGEIFYQAIQAKARIYIAQSKFKEANKILKEIYDFKKEDSEYLDALAQSYIYTGAYKEAETCYEKALSVCQDASFSDYIRIKLEYLANFEGDYENNPSRDIVLNLSSDKRKLIKKIYSNMRNQCTIKDKYNKRYQEEKKKRASWYEENYLMCLKGWSSSTPELSMGLLNNNIKNGGGFYLHYENIGIVIDPGINFLENMHKNGLFIQDINVVIVTHNHIDHNNDLSKILDMAYQINHSIYYYVDKETYAKFQIEFEDIEKQSGKHVIKMFHDASAREKKKTIRLEGKRNKIDLEICKTEHKCEGAYGLKLTLKDQILGYTSDTGYTESIGDFFEDCDMLLANVSETNKDDIMLQKYKETHLGIYGIYSLLTRFKKKKTVCMISEFWGGFGDIRLEIAEVIKEYLHQEEVDVVPVDIGMVYFLNDKTFLCNSCGEVTSSEGRRIVRIGDEGNKGLFCLCGNCSYE